MFIKNQFFNLIFILILILYFDLCFPQILKPIAIPIFYLHEFTTLLFLKSQIQFAFAPFILPFPFRELCSSLIPVERILPKFFYSPCV